MLKFVIKRSGEKVDYVPKKIKIAITSAIIAEEKENTLFEASVTPEYITAEVEKLLLKTNLPAIDIETIQDTIIDVLSSVGEQYKLVAARYEAYRRERELIRKGIIQRSIEVANEYMAKGDLTKENSNVDFSIQGLNMALSGEQSKLIWLYKDYNEEIRNAHLTGALHIHDLSFYGAYCTGWSLKELLLCGISGVAGKTSAGPAKNFSTAMMQVVNFLFTLQNEVAGAVAFNNIDTLLAPFITYDNLSYKDVKDIMQQFMHNINCHTRIGAQSPFTNVTMDIQCPKHYANEPIILGGKMIDDVYGNHQKSMNMFNKAFSELMLHGDYEGRVFSFPIPTYNIDKNFEWENKSYDPIWKMTAKMGTPYFANFVNSDMDPEDIRSMCCRMSLDLRKIRERSNSKNEDDRKQARKKQGGLFGAGDLTGSIGVVTVNMPRIGYLTSTKEEFYKELYKQMDIARDSLRIKRRVLEENTEKGMYPYCKVYLKNNKQRLGGYWAGHFSTIGLVGMEEACINFFKDTKRGIPSEEGHAFAKEVLIAMRDRIAQYSVDEDVDYNLEATPAEGTSLRLFKCDEKRYNIETCGRKCYTNSTMPPVDFTSDIFDRLDNQDDLQTQYTGGTVEHMYIGEKIEPEQVPVMLKKVLSNYKLPYVSLTPTFSHCSEHGYIQGEEWECPTCGKDTEVYTRVVGYYRPVSRWNSGKQHEHKTRKNYEIESFFRDATK